MFLQPNPEITKSIKKKINTKQLNEMTSLQPQTKTQPFPLFFCKKRFCSAKQNTAISIEARLLAKITSSFADSLHVKDVDK